MTRRIRIAAATVMVAAGLIGAVAAPASAAESTFQTTRTCELRTGGTATQVLTNSGSPLFLSWQGVAENCVPGTLRITVERL